MARIRQIKPDFYLDDELAAHCSRDARFLFTGLWVIADRRGRLEDRPARIKVQVFPYDEDVSAKTVDGLLDQLARGGYIIRYSNSGTPLIQVRTFEKHQHCHVNEPESKFPGPDEGGSEPYKADAGMMQKPDISDAGTVQEPEKHGSRRGTSTSTVTSTSTSTGGNPVSPAAAPVPLLKKQETKQQNPSCADPNSIDEVAKRAGSIPSVIAFELAEALRNAILARDPHAECSTSKDCVAWAREMDKILRRRPREQIEQVIEFSQHDSFWAGNILDATALRQKFDQLWGKMQRDSPDLRDRHEKKLRRVHEILGESEATGERRAIRPMAAKSG